VNRSDSFPITVVYNCEGAESIATMSLEIYLAPYDPIFVSWQKLCPFTANSPEMPMDLIATHQYGQVQLSWAPPGDDNGARVHFYILEAFALGTTHPISISLSTDFNTPSHVASLNPVTYVWQGLPGGKSYMFRVAAVNQAGTSAFSPASTPVNLPPSAPGTPGAAGGPAYVPPPTPAGFPNPYAPPGSTPPPTAPHSKATGSVSSAGEGWSTGGVFFFWTFMLGALACLGTCIWRSNHGEQGFEIVPGYSILYELDDRYFGSRITSQCRLWSPLAGNDVTPTSGGFVHEERGGLAPDRPAPSQKGGFVSSETGNPGQAFPMKETTTFGGHGGRYNEGPAPSAAEASELYGQGAAPVSTPTPAISAVPATPETPGYHL